MSGTHHPANRQLRAVKKGLDIKDQVRYIHELRSIQQMRERLVHQLPQIFATTDPRVPDKHKTAIKVEPSGSTTDARIVSGNSTAVKVEPTDPVKKEPDSNCARVNGRDRSKSVRFATNVENEIELIDLVEKEPTSISASANDGDRSESKDVGSHQKNETLDFFIALAAYLLGFGTLFLGILFLCDPSIFAKSRVPTKLVALVIGRLYMGIGIAMLILGYQKHLRALGTMLLCEAVAEIVMMVLARISGFEIDFLVGVPVTAVKGGLGLWMISSRE